MKTILRFDTRNALALPPEFRQEDVRFSDAFAEHFIERYSRPADVVFDPFAGYGTTLYAAEKLDRRALGVELLPERAAFIQARLREPSAVYCADSLKLRELALPPIDLVLTSPPYMQRTGHPEYPLSGYRVTGQGYEDYLRDITDIFRQVKEKLKPAAYAVIEVANLVTDGAFTPLAWDIARSVADVLPLRREIVAHWGGEASPTYGFGCDHSYALIFQAERAN